MKWMLRYFPLFLLVCTTAWAQFADPGLEGGSGDVPPLLMTPSENSRDQESPDTENPATPPSETAPLVEEMPPEAVAPPVQTTPKSEAPEIATTSEKPAPLTEDEEILFEAPTRSIEAYEIARKKRLYKVNAPAWGVNLTVNPKAFGKADLRSPSRPNQFPSELTSPRLVGVLIGGEKIFFKKAGMASIGAEGGVYSGKDKNGFSGMQTAFFSAGPYLYYEAAFLNRQWFVPSFKAQLEGIRYKYRFNNADIKGMRAMPRVEAGLLFFLNILEPSSAGQMANNYGIKRTYLGAFYTLAVDNNKKDFDLSEQAIRLGLRFEI